MWHCQANLPDSAPRLAKIAKPSDNGIVSWFVMPTRAEIHEAYLQAQRLSTRLFFNLAPPYQPERSL
jgi:hypothetical protein